MIHHYVIGAVSQQVVQRLRLLRQSLCSVAKAGVRFSVSRFVYIELAYSILTVASMKFEANLKFHVINSTIQK